MKLRWQLKSIMYSRTESVIILFINWRYLLAMSRKSLQTDDINKCSRSTIVVRIQGIILCRRKNGIWIFAQTKLFLQEERNCSDRVPSQHIRMFGVSLQIWSTHWHNSNSWDTNIIGITSELWLIFTTCYHLVNKQCLTGIRQLLSKSASKS